MIIYYFGCRGRQCGHFWWPRERSTKRRPETYVPLIGPDGFPWPYPDGKLCPGHRRTPGSDVEREHQVEGHVAYHARDGWSVIAFWDRSADERYGSNSLFAVHDVVAAEALLDLARAVFPDVFARHDFTVQLIESKDGS